MLGLHCPEEVVRELKLLSGHMVVQGPKPYCLKCGHLWERILCTGGERILECPGTLDKALERASGCVDHLDLERQILALEGA